MPPAQNRSFAAGMECGKRTTAHDGNVVSIPWWLMFCRSRKAIRTEAGRPLPCPGDETKDEPMRNPGPLP
jgi:hypothetical protein